MIQRLRVRARFASKLAHDSLAMGIGDIVARLCILIATIHLARVLGAAGFGSYTFSLSLFVYLNMISDLGLEWAGVRRIGQLAKQNPPAIGAFVAGALGLRLALLLPAYIVFTLCVLVVLRLGDVFVLALAPFGVALLFGAVLPDWFLTGLQEFRLVATSRILRWACFALLVFLLVRSPADIVWASSCYAIAFGLCVLVLWTQCKARLGIQVNASAINSAQWAEMLVRAPFTLSYTVIQQAYFQIMTLLLGLIGTDMTVGFYSAASRVPVTVIGGLSVFINVLFPTIARLGTLEAAQDLLRLWTRGIVIFSGPAVSLLIVMPDVIVVSIFGSQYERAASMVAWLAPTIITLPLVTLFAAALTAVGQGRPVLFAVAIGAIVMLFCEALIGRTWPLEGPAVSTLIGSLVALWTLGRASHFSLVPKVLVVPFGAMVSVGVLVYELRNAIVAVVPAIGALSLIVVVGVAGAITYFLALRVGGHLYF